MPFSEYGGFLGSRSSLSMDIAFVILLVMIPVFSWSLELLLLRKNYQLHKKIQLFLSLAFLIATVLFCLDFFLYGWEHRTAEPDGKIPRITYMTLTIHLVFWGVTALMWIVLLVQSLRKIPNPPGPCDFGPTYIFWLIMLVLQLFLTTLTGWEFYMLAFCFG